MYAFKIFSYTTLIDYTLVDTLVIFMDFMKVFVSQSKFQLYLTKNIVPLSEIDLHCFISG